MMGGFDMGEDIGLRPPHPNRKPHPANGMIADVDLGDGAAMSIVDPSHDSGAVWTLIWGEAEDVKYAAASMLESYDYLLSSEITAKEANRRLRILRQARRDCIDRARAHPSQQAASAAATNKTSQEGK